MELEDTNTQMEAAAMQARQERDELKEKLEKTEGLQQRLSELESEFAAQQAMIDADQVSPGEFSCDCCRVQSLIC